MKMFVLPDFSPGLESSTPSPDNTTPSAKAADQKANKNEKNSESPPPEFALELACATLNQSPEINAESDPLKTEVQASLKASADSQQKQQFPLILKNPVDNSDQSTSKKEKLLKKASAEIVLPFPPDQQLAIHHLESNSHNALPSASSKLDLDKHLLVNDKDRKTVFPNKALPNEWSPTDSNPFSASLEDNIAKLEHHTGQETPASLPDLSRPASPPPSALPANSVLPNAPDTHNFRSFTPSLNQPLPSPQAAPIYAQAMEDPTLRMQVLPENARLFCQINGDELRLHLRLRDKVADVRIEGIASESFRHKNLELGAALASEGLQLGSFDLSQEQQRNPYSAYCPDEDAAPSGPTPSPQLVKPNAKESASTSTSAQTLPGTVHLEV